MQNEKSSSDQLELGRSLAQRNGWIVGGEFADEACSGRSSRNRPQFNKMISMAVGGQAQAIIVEDISRLFRNAAEMHVCAQRLKEAGVVIVTAAGSVVDGLELSIRAAMAQEQSEEHGRRVKRGHRAAAKRGRVIGGVAYGYRVRQAAGGQEAFVAGKNGDGGDDLNREIDPDEGPVVQRIYEDFVAGLSTQQICKALNSERVPAPGGGLWRTNALTGNKDLNTGILRSPIYRGRVVFGKTVSTFRPSTGTTKVTPGDKTEQIQEVREELRLVSDETWLAAQARLASLSVERQRPNQARRPTYVLSGKVFCGACGGSYAILGHTHGCYGRRFSSACDNRRRVARLELERAVFKGMVERLLKPHILNIYLAEYRSELAKAAAEFEGKRTTLAKRQADLMRDIDNLVAQAEAGATGYARTRINDRINELGAQLEQVERQLVQRAPVAADDATAEVIIERMRALLDELGDAAAGDDRAAATAREVMRGMIDKVIVTPKPATGKEDGRGFGPVMVQVFGSITRVVDYAGGREVQSGGTTSAALDLPNVSFYFYVPMAPAIARQEHPPAEAGLFLHLLKVAYGPVQKDDLIRALRDGQDPANAQQMAAAHLGAEKAIRFLKTRGDIRAVDLPRWQAGWVLNGRGLTDDEWRERFRNPEGEGPPPLWRYATPPEAFVTVIG